MSDPAEKSPSFAYNKSLRGIGSITMKCNTGIYKYVSKDNDSYYLGSVEELIDRVKLGIQKYETVFSEDKLSCNLILKFDPDNIEFTLHKEISTCVLM
ncbi:MAG: hypothetical protein Hyperionvirus7_51 [Hyperionvirus sp.]|uniref:Uncharacterized protein n=1 Tax=Hyperionvirus sp. TaxID=2487770 RepID=A0A3G5A859_9VIRU|nr:MAG: hypothetical protein Hyperionvirus7_51 [Hyperionvirus sp.]